MDILTKDQLNNLPKAKQERYIKLLQAREAKAKLRKIDTYYPPGGVLGRENYPKHMDFLTAGKKYRERCFIAANRVGKTQLGAYEISCHMTGEYPEWWPGRVFDHPVKVWCAGDTGKTVRDIIQLELLGPPGEYGTGMIPGEAIEKTTPKHGLPDAVEGIYVKHKSGGTSSASLKSYDQGRRSFQGTAIDAIWLDEECDMSIYSECLLRTMTTGGVVMVTFTPLMGITDVVKSFYPDLGTGDTAYH